MHPVTPSRTGNGNYYANYAPSVSPLSYLVSLVVPNDTGHQPQHLVACWKPLILANSPMQDPREHRFFFFFKVHWGVGSQKRQYAKVDKWIQHNLRIALGFFASTPEKVY